MDTAQLLKIEGSIAAILSGAKGLHRAAGKLAESCITDIYEAVAKFRREIGSAEVTPTVQLEKPAITKKKSNEEKIAERQARLAAERSELMSMREPEVVEESRSNIPEHIMQRAKEELEQIRRDLYGG
ncbi:MAG TPA: hypothetical protein VF944_10845 [Candidatus Bathyarchaeia archaeon]